jgi:hypothetical protein
MPGCTLLVNGFISAVYGLIHVLFFRQFLIRVIPALCWTFHTITAMLFMYRGSLRVYDTQLPCKTRLVCSFFTTMLCINLVLERRCALAYSGSSDSIASRIAPSICSILNSPKLTSRPLRINTEDSNVSSKSRHARSIAPSILSPTHTQLSPICHICHGWCDYDVKPHANVVGIRTLLLPWCRHLMAPHIFPL